MHFMLLKEYTVWNFFHKLPERYQHKCNLRKSIIATDEKIN